MNETLEKVTELINRASQLTGHDMAGSFYAVTGETDLDFEDSDPMRTTERKEGFVYVFRNSSISI